MGNNLFGANISGIINSVIGPSVLPATLIKITPSSRNPSDPTAGVQPTETQHSCRGFIDDYADSVYRLSIIEQGDRKITLIGDSIAGDAIPKANDKIIIEGGTYLVKRVNRDPDAATYECQSRG